MDAPPRGAGTADTPRDASGGKRHKRGPGPLASASEAAPKKRCGEDGRQRSNETAGGERI